MKIVSADDFSSQITESKLLKEEPGVREIINNVRENGDRALLEYTRKFDSVTIEKIKVDKNRIKNSYDCIKDELIEALEYSKRNIEKFARKQREQFNDFEIEIKPGVIAGQKIIPVERAGVYVPGGKFPLVSTVLMGVIPAGIAGVREIIICSPPTCEEDIHPAILMAADLCGVDKIYRIGGAQAIAAMAYGTETVEKVNTIAGPGNRYVTAAKKYLYGEVGIDLLAGPSEILIIADKKANPEFITRDLLAQAEHDINAVPLLITDSEELAEKIINGLEVILSNSSTDNTAEISLRKNGKIIMVESPEEAVKISNNLAPEHLELQVSNPEDYIDNLNNYGSLFIGSLSAEVLGDYSAGINHTLPTSGCAKFTAGLNVSNFLKMQTTLEVTEKGLQEIGPPATTIGKAEGLSNHVKSIEVRLKEVD